MYSEPHTEPGFQRVVWQIGSNHHKKLSSKAVFMCNICTWVYFCTPYANLHPRCILCHVNGVLRKYTRVQKYTWGAKILRANLPLLSRWSKLKLNPRVFLHPCANTAHEHGSSFRAFISFHIEGQTITAHHKDKFCLFVYFQA